VWQKGDGGGSDGVVCGAMKGGGAADRGGQCHAACVQRRSWVPDEWASLGG
jgi:hypothetical protein